MLDKRKLQSYAGWALTQRNLGSTGFQVAVGRFGDACSELAEYVHEFNCHPAKERVSEVSTLSEHPQTPEEILQILDARDTQGGCKHKFSIHTQLCNWCGLSYREVYGHAPELF